MDDTLGSLINAARTAQKMSLRDLGSRVGVTASYLCDIEKDRRLPADPVFYRIVATLEMDADTAYAYIGRLDSATLRYMRAHPRAVALLRTLARRNVDDETLRVLIKECHNGR